MKKKEVGGAWLWVLGQPGLRSEFWVSQGYTETVSIKKKEKLIWDKDRREKNNQQKGKKLHKVDHFENINNWQSKQSRTKHEQQVLESRERKWLKVLNQWFSTLLNAIL